MFVRFENATFKCKSEIAFLYFFNTWKLKKQIKLIDVQIIDLPSIIRIRMMNWIILFFIFFLCFYFFSFVYLSRLANDLRKKRFEWSDGVLAAGGRIVFESKNIISLGSVSRKWDESNYSLPHNARLMAVDVVRWSSFWALHTVSQDSVSLPLWLRPKWYRKLLNGLLMPTNVSAT